MVVVCVTGSRVHGVLARRLPLRIANPLFRSFGVTMVEMFQKIPGSLPFCAYDTPSLAECMSSKDSCTRAVQAMLTSELEISVPHIVRKIARDCCSYEQADRPKFGEVVLAILDFQQGEGRWEVQRSDIKELVKHLGRGSFGTVDLYRVRWGGVDWICPARSSCHTCHDAGVPEPIWPRA